MARSRDKDRNWWLRDGYKAKHYDEVEPVTCVNYAGAYRISPEAGDIREILFSSLGDCDLSYRISLGSRYAKPWRKKRK